MHEMTIMSGVLIDDAALSLDELARACTRWASINVD
jgi:hypothetical protein